MPLSVATCPVGRLGRSLKIGQSPVPLQGDSVVFTVPQLEESGSTLAAEQEDLLTGPGSTLPLVMPDQPYH